MLILEGPDLTGKTTLCYLLVWKLNLLAVESKTMPFVYRHFTRLPDGAWDYYWDYLPHICRGIVQDRFHVSEMVYGPVHKGVSRVTIEIARLLQGHLNLVGGMTVLITADDELIEQQYKDKGSRQEMYQLGQILEVNQRYKGLAIEKPELFDLQINVSAEPRTTWPAENDTLIETILVLYHKRQNNLRRLCDERPDRHR